VHRPILPSWMRVNRSFLPSGDQDRCCLKSPSFVRRVGSEEVSPQRHKEHKGKTQRRPASRKQSLVILVKPLCSLCLCGEGHQNNSSMGLPLGVWPIVASCSLVSPTAENTVAARSPGVHGRSCGCSPSLSLLPTTRPPLTPPPAKKAL